MSNAREELREALAAGREMCGDGSLSLTGPALRLRKAADAILAEPSPVYSEEQVLVRKDRLESLRLLESLWAISSCGDSAETRDMARAVRRLCKFAQPAPVSPSHPEVIEYEGKRWKFVGAAMSDPDIRVNDLVVSVDQKTKTIMPEGFVKEFVNGRVWEGAALYRLIEPRVWEFECDADSFQDARVNAGIPGHVHVKAVVTEILETEKS